MNSDLTRAFFRGRISARAAELWGLPEDRLRHVRSGRSFVFAFNEGDRRGVLKITPQTNHSYQQVKAELEFVNFLLERGVPVVEPLTSRRGELVEALETPLGSFAVTAMARLEVKKMLWSSDHESLDVYRQLGRITGQIHQAARSYVPPGARRPRWDEEWPLDEPAIRRYLPDRETRDEYDEVLDWLRNKAELPDDFGLIHGDVALRNVGFDDTGMRFFDFDDCYYHWFCFDLVVPLSLIADQPEGLRRRQFDALLDGYQQANQLPSDYQEQINWLWRWKTVSRSASGLLGYDRLLSAPWEENRRQLSAFPVDSLPPWVQNSRHKLYQQMFGQLRW